MRIAAPSPKESKLLSLAKSFQLRDNTYHTEKKDAALSRETPKHGDGMKGDGTYVRMWDMMSVQ